MLSKQIDQRYRIADYLLQSYAWMFLVFSHLSPLERFSKIQGNCIVDFPKIKCLLLHIEGQWLKRCSIVSRSSSSLQARLYSVAISDFGCSVIMPIVSIMSFLPVLNGFWNFTASEPGPCFVGQVGVKGIYLHKKITERRIYGVMYMCSQLPRQFPRSQLYLCDQELSEGVFVLIYISQSTSRFRRIMPYTILSFNRSQLNQY